MHDNQTVFRHISDTDTAKLAWKGLTPDLLERARSRIKTLAWLMFIVLGIGGLLDTVFFFAVTHRFEMFWLASTGVAALMSVGLILIARDKRVGHLTVLHAGLFYEIGICLLVSLFWPELYYSQWSAFPFVTWVEPLIILFPLIIPSPPSMTLVVAILAGATRPLGLLLLSLWRDIEVPAAVYFVSVVSPGFAVVLAYYGSRIVHGMTVDLARAQRMGSYKLESRLGEGGMGEVWRARHQLLAREAAVKLIRPDSLGRGTEQQQVTLARFEREAQATALMRSPHTIQIYDFGITQNGTFYYVMELLDGLDLDAFVKRFGPMRPGRVSHLVQQVCDSLGEAHERGLIHRDIKPANIYLCRYGRRVDFAKVLDFGLVKAVSRHGQDPALTAKDVVGGTPAFMAPEQILGHDVDLRADIYSMGGVLYWLLTGELPFQGHNPMETMVMHVEKTPPLPSNRAEQAVPPELDRIVLGCLEKKPENRPQSADELAHMLGALDNGNVWTEERAREWWRQYLPDPDLG